MKNLGNVVEGKDIANVETINEVSGNGSTLVKAPVGSIVIWSGTADDIPTGWHLCDGTNGTPDLRDKFVLGAGTGHSVGDSGGSEEVKLTSTQIPTHSHTLSGYNTGGNAGPGVNQYGSLMQSTNGGNFTTGNPNIMNRILFTTSNALGFPTNTNLVSAHENMPPYYTLCYIMKLSADETDCGEVYSTEETRIGTWIDGKPLYRKCYTATTPSSSGSYKPIIYDSTLFQNIKGVIHIYGYVVYSSNNLPPINLYVTSENYVGTWFLNGKIQMICTSGWINKPCYVVIEYVKTTDA